jgi:two-component system, NtrC family, response regulator
VTENKPRLLIVEDDLGLQKQLKWCFDKYQVLIAGTRAEALAQLRRFEPPVVLQDLGLPPDAEGVSEGVATLKQILDAAPQTKIIVVTGNNDRDNAVRSVSIGAYDFYQKPVDTDVLRLIVSRAFHMHALEEENRQLRQARFNAPFEGLIAIDDAMLKVCRMIEKVGPTNATVLLLGESGTGKELLARAVHQLSLRREGPFVPINCAAIPETLLESELFGYEKGAFTGAARTTLGRIETAQGGTLFLDEIGDMPAALQAKLLRFLQGREIERVGGRDRIPVDVRIVCATNRDLSVSITDGAFRPDLYYRISETAIRIPPLRERKGDAVAIAQWILDSSMHRHRRSRMMLAEDAVAAIQTYPWPGNIRELENRVNNAVIMTDGIRIRATDLGLEDPGDDAAPLSLRQARSRAERSVITQALTVAKGNVSRAATLLGITRPTLYDLLERLQIKVNGSDE